MSWISPSVITFELASQSGNCSVQFNFLSASSYQATLMVIQVVKEDRSFGTKAFLVSCYYSHPFRTRCLSWRNPLHVYDQNPMSLALFLCWPPKSSDSFTKHLIVDTFWSACIENIWRQNSKPPSKMIFQHSLIFSSFLSCCIYPIASCSAWVINSSFIIARSQRL